MNAPEQFEGQQFDLVVIARRTITTSGERSCEIGVHDGRIVAVRPLGTGLDGRRRLALADDEVLLPGLVDTHVHVNEPGRTEWEGFASATRAAAAGGVTTILDMPLNSVPPTVNAAALDIKRHVARGQCHVDVGFWGGAIPGNTDQLTRLQAEGVFGFKCFLSPSGVDEFPPLTADQMQAAMAVVQELDSLLLVHAEDSATLAQPPAGKRSYRDFLVSRPRDAENLAIDAVIERARHTGVRAHVLHLSSSDAVSGIAAARLSGVAITVETCPHYLSLAAEEVPDGATQFKCCPPIREASNRELLWAALADGVIDCIVSDHSPCTGDLKQLDTGDFGTAWGGVASLQLGLPIIWTEAQRRGHPLTDVVRWMATRPAEIVGLPHKGRIAPGQDADLVVFAPAEEFVVDPAQLHHKNPITPYAGRTLSGVVRRTLLRGVEVTGHTPTGQLLSSNA